MDLENQRRVKSLAEQYGPENIVVLLGAAEGEAAGREEMKLELARTMKAKGMETQAITEITGLTSEDIEKL